MIEWRQSFLNKTRKFPLDFQKGRRAKVRQAGPRGHEVYSLGEVQKAAEETAGMRDRVQTGSKRADSPHEPCSGAVGTAEAPGHQQMLHQPVGGGMGERGAWALGQRDQDGNLHFEASEPCVTVAKKTLCCFWASVFLKGKPLVELNRVSSY